jgi:CheY-like chemotaxis protein
LRILLAEDYLFNREVVEGYLEQSPVQIDVAENGLQALNLFQTGHYDLVLMDMQMPVMDGYTATQEIRRYEQQQGRAPIPIIALSAFALQEEIDKSLAAGCNEHLSKPVQREDLLDCLARHSST